MLKTKFRQSSHRPVLNVRRRLPTVTNLPKYSSTDIIGENVTTVLPLLDETTNLKNNRRTNSIYRTTTLRSNTELKNKLKTTPTHTRNYSKPTHQFLNRRTYVRPEKRRSTTINLDSIDIDTTTVESSTLRNTNALFRRRYTSTYSPNINILTTVPTSTINIDQEAGSSIQDSKFINKKINIIERNLNVEEKIDRSTKEFSKSSVSDTINTTPQYTEQNTSLIDFVDLENIEFSNLKPNKTISQKNINRSRPTESPKILKNISRRPQYGNNNNYQFAQRTYRPIIDYDYYDEEDVRVVSKSNALVKVILHGDGIIECLDQGNFPHPVSCRKFISCAKMGKDSEGAIGWEYTCPKGLSYDPVGGICNWSSGLGCKE